MYGPMEYIVVEFPGNKFNGEVIPELAKIVEQGLIRIIDLLFVSKDPDGNIQAFELNDMDPAMRERIHRLAPNVTGLVSTADVEKIGAVLENNSSAGVLVIEHLWAAGFRNAIIQSGGRLVAQERISPEDLEATLEELEEMAKQ